MKKIMKRLVNKVLFKFGYIEYDPFERLLHEVVKESVRRDGELISVREMGLRVRVQATTDDF